MTTSFLANRSTLLALGCAGAALLGVVAPSSYATLAPGRPAAAPHAAAEVRDAPGPAGPHAAVDAPGGAGSPRTGRPASTPYVETRLFFGTQRPDGGPAVTGAQFTSFVDREVTPSFPEGLTVLDGQGQWRDSHGTIEHERSHELILLYTRREASRRGAAVERIRAAYVRAYGQDSVARLDETATADF
ncbi:DUF3574 domain-containing protein [Streptomyces fuscigenes]|uniref:DUF3574 domain-containing protein n=1 Tax=Streptomyces fuscigenes TaxID=1528880 RepID=UPI001F4105B2|nr:DUF3574 domain-containing protein [Streptomyces fuscigenes]MCF3964262.1 DUF3574 domain-containing protein [Streptomyces fuscigenes]